jgi:hypothetical protein
MQLLPVLLQSDKEPNQTASRSSNYQHRQPTSMYIQRSTTRREEAHRASLTNPRTVTFILMRLLSGKRLEKMLIGPLVDRIKRFEPSASAELLEIAKEAPDSFV